jgi:hypothetical protein
MTGTTCPLSSFATGEHHDPGKQRGRPGRPVALLRAPGRAAARRLLSVSAADTSVLNWNGWWLFNNIDCSALPPPQRAVYFRTIPSKDSGRRILTRWWSCPVSAHGGRICRDGKAGPCVAARCSAAYGEIAYRLVEGFETRYVERDRLAGGMVSDPAAAPVAQGVA